MPDRPDFVFFMLDQLSARWLEAASGGVVPTPHIDRLRARGVSFSRCYTANPVCMPARATMATGMTTRGHGVLQNGYQLSAELPTFWRLLQQAGWQTGALGKVHLRPHFAGLRPEYGDYGFDEIHITEDGRGGEWLDWVESAHPEHYEAALATMWATGIPDLAAYGPGRVDLGARIRRVREGFRWGTERFPGSSAQEYTLPFPEEVSQTAWITAHAVDFIERADPARPLLAHVGYVQPHGPFCPPEEYMDRVCAGAIPEPCGVEWADDPRAPVCFPRDDAGRPGVGVPENWREIRRYYFADIAHLDDQLGKVTAALERAGRLANTHVVLLADHGEMLLDHGFRGKEERHYDACIRVPLIVAGPGVDEGTTRGEFVQLEDVFPTVLDASGLELPAPKTMGPYLRGEPARTAGRSLLPLCRGEEPTDRRAAAYVESYNTIGNCTPANWARTVVTERWRYTMYPGGAGEQLFDLVDDPCEQRNRAGDPTCAEVRHDLRARLLDLIILQDHPHTPRDLFAHGVH